MEMGNVPYALGRRWLLMWSYEKRLQYPVNITTPNAKLAQVIITQYGGPDGEMSASMRYLSQRYSVPYPEIAAVLTDIGISEAVPLPIAICVIPASAVPDPAVWKYARSCPRLTPPARLPQKRSPSWQ